MSVAGVHLTAVEIPEGVSDRKGQIRWGIAKTGKIFACKHEVWNQQPLPFRLAHELIYYSIADISGLQMPLCGVVELEGKKYWGSEFKLGRTSLAKEGTELTGESLKRISALFKESVVQRQSYLRAMLLDLAMVNGDRPPWNILVDELEGHPNFWFYDHDRSLGWRGNGDPARIAPPKEEAARLNGYLGADYLTGPALAASSRDEVLRIFHSLEFDLTRIAEIRPIIPSEWMTECEFSTLHDGIGEWWEYLAREFEAKMCDQVLTFGK